MLIKSFSDDWKWWIWNYVKSEKNKENLFVILLNHGFEYDLISQELGYYPTNARTIKRRDSQKALDNNDPCYIFPLYKPSTATFIYIIQINHQSPSSLSFF